MPKKFRSEGLLMVERVDPQDRVSARSQREYKQCNVDLQGGLRISAFEGTRNFDLYCRLQEGDQFAVSFDGMRILMNPNASATPTGGEATVQAAPTAALPPRVLLTDAEIDWDTYTERPIHEAEKKIMEREAKAVRKVEFQRTSLLRAVGDQTTGEEEVIEPGFEEG